MKTIEKLTEKDLACVMAIYADARRFMRETGNLTQWAGGYPSEGIVLGDIESGKLYACKEDGTILGVFYFAVENDPTYDRIYDGAWLNDRPYAVIHRVAVSEESHGKGVAGFIFEHCFAEYPNLKIDTHRDNIPMQRALIKRGFVQCGVIFLLNGEERLAFQRQGI